MATNMNTPTAENQIVRPMARPRIVTGKQYLAALRRCRRIPANTRPCSRTRRPFFEACATGDVAVLRELLANDPRWCAASRADSRGWTGLHSRRSRVISRRCGCCSSTAPIPMRARKGTTPARCTGPPRHGTSRSCARCSMPAATCTALATCTKWTRSAGRRSSTRTKTTRTSSRHAGERRWRCSWRAARAITSSRRSAPAISIDPIGCRAGSEGARPADVEVRAAPDADPFRHQPKALRHRGPVDRARRRPGSERRHTARPRSRSR